MAMKLIIAAIAIMNLISFHDDDGDDYYPRLKIRLQETMLCKMFSEIINEICCLPYVQHFFQTMCKVAGFLWCIITEGSFQPCKLKAGYYCCGSMY
jgi:hypothetical protein